MPRHVKTYKIFKEFKDGTYNMGEYFVDKPEIVFCLAICTCKIVEITLSSLKTVFLVKGQKLISASLAFIECIIWGLVVSSVISSLGTNFYWLLSYCLGYAIGYALGSTIESMLAIGTMDVQLIVPKDKSKLVEEYLIQNNLGFYICECRGKNGVQDKFDTIIPRKKAKQTRKELTDICNGEIFVTNFDVSYVRGGYSVKTIK